MRLPYVNLKIIALTLVVVLLLLGGAGGWLWYSGQPSKLYESAREEFQRAEAARGAGNPSAKPSDEDLAKAKKSYDHALALLNLFLDKVLKDAPKDSRLADAYMLRYKILTPLSRINDKEEQARNVPQGERKASGQAAEAYRSAHDALAINDQNVEAEAAVLADHFRRNDFRGVTVRLARSLIDNLATTDPKTIELDDFNDYVVGAYFVLALKEVDEHPDQALKHLDASLDREKPRPGSGKVEPRWRAVDVEIRALQKKVDLAAKQPLESKAAEAKLQSRLAEYVKRAQEELNDGSKPLTTLSETNTNGLVDVLVMSLKSADSHKVVQERADVLTEVCKALANAPEAKPYAAQIAVSGMSRLLTINGGLPAANRLTSEEMARKQEEALAINDAVLAKGGPIDLMAYIEMSRTAQQQNNRERALEMARKGLKVAADQHIPAGDARVLSLEAQAAWMLLLDRKVKEAEEYLALISKQSKMATDVAYMRGLGAVLDGRLEEGVQQLTVARTNPQNKDNLALLLALSHAYLGQGQLEQALPVLEQLYAIRKREQVKNREDEFWVKLWQPSLTHASLSLFKCRLALALRVAETPKDAKLADAYEQRATRELLPEIQGDFLGDEAVAALLNYKQARLRQAEKTSPGSLQADTIRGEIKKIMDGLPASSRNDPRLLWAEVGMILNQPETNPTEVGGAIAAALGAPSDMAVRLGELGRLRAAFAYQWQKAEQRIMQAAADQKDVATQLTWVRWLLLNGRTEDAIAKLAELEDQARDDKERRQLLAARARLLLGSGRRDKADEIIQELRKDGKDLTGEMLYAEEVLASGDPNKANAILKNALNKQDQSGLYHFWQGQQAQQNGDFAQAIQSYERSMQFTQFKSRSQNGLLGCVLGIANGPAGKPDKANPEEAFKEVKRLRTAHPKDPVVLLAYAMIARQMDEIYGDGGMEGALADMIRIVGEDKGIAVSGPYLAAQQWAAAGRPDRARAELKNNTAHLPSVVFATQLAIADEDWPEVAEGLKTAEKLDPNAVDLPLWRAALHEAKGEIRDAKEIYTKFVETYPKSNAGYLALARLHERAKEYKEALEWVKKWRDKMPEELNGQEALVRVLAHDGQLADAVKQADAFIKEALEKARTGRAEWEAKNPIAEKDPAKAKELTEQRAKDRAALLDALDLTLTLQYVGVFQQVKAYAEAETWLSKRALPLLEKLPEETRKGNRLTLKLVHATLYLEQGRQLKEKSVERARLMDKAIQEYDDIYKEQPGNLVAGNNLAWLLVKEKNDPARALGLIEETRKGKFSRQPVTPERLPLEFLDTIGVVYRANGMSQESLSLFKDAVERRYGKEPRVIWYLGLAQEALSFRSDAAATFRKVINLADERGRVTADPDRKDVLARLALDAKEEQKKIGAGGLR